MAAGAVRGLMGSVEWRRGGCGSGVFSASFGPLRAPAASVRAAPCHSCSSPFICGLRFLEQSSQPCVFGYMRACLALRFAATRFWLPSALFCSSQCRVAPGICRHSWTSARSRSPGSSTSLRVVCARASGSSCGVASRAGQFRWAASERKLRVRGRPGVLEGPRQAGSPRPRCGRQNFTPQKKMKICTRVLGKTPVGEGLRMTVQDLA